MKKLETGEFHRVAPLIESSEMKGCRAKWYSVLEGRQEGAIIVDDPGCPRVALVCGHRVGAYYAFGEANGEVLRPFVPELLSEHLAPGYCALFATSEAWQQTLDTLFTTGYSRLAFAFQPAPGWPPLDWRERLPPAFALERVDAARAEVIQENMGGPWFSHLWGSIEDFLARGVGFCIVAAGLAVWNVGVPCLSVVPRPSSLRPPHASLPGSRLTHCSAWSSAPPTARLVPVLVRQVAPEVLVQPSGVHSVDWIAVGIGV